MYTLNLLFIAAAIVSHFALADSSSSEDGSLCDKDLGKCFKKVVMGSSHWQNIFMFCGIKYNATVIESQSTINDSFVIRSVLGQDRTWIGNVLSDTVQCCRPKTELECRELDCDPCLIDSGFIDTYPCRVRHSSRIPRFALCERAISSDDVAHTPTPTFITTPTGTATSSFTASSTKTPTVSVTPSPTPSKTSSQGSPTVVAVTTSNVAPTASYSAVSTPTVAPASTLGPTTATASYSIIVTPKITPFPTPDSTTTFYTTSTATSETSQSASGESDKSESTTTTASTSSSSSAYIKPRKKDRCMNEVLYYVENKSYCKKYKNKTLFDHMCTLKPENAYLDQCYPFVDPENWEYLCRTDLDYAMVHLSCQERLNLNVSTMYPPRCLLSDFVLDSRCMRYHDNATIAHLVHDCTRYAYLYTAPECAEYLDLVVYPPQCIHSYYRYTEECKKFWRPMESNEDDEDYYFDSDVESVFMSFNFDNTVSFVITVICGVTILAICFISCMYILFRLCRCFKNRNRASNVPRSVRTDYTVAENLQEDVEGDFTHLTKEGNTNIELEHMDGV